jgi:hypothetical protein
MAFRNCHRPTLSCQSLEPPTREIKHGVRVVLYPPMGIRPGLWIGTWEVLAGRLTAKRAFWGANWDLRRWLRIDGYATGARRGRPSNAAPDGTVMISIASFNQEEFRRIMGDSAENTTTLPRGASLEGAPRLRG